ncbi:MAG: DNA replication and repair protein RecF [Treponema sp.]|nr:DNA replication and repair protein RecF [Treponema sp.]
MVFSSLRTTAFRNLADSVVRTSSKTVFLVGENGQGKTNFLEALYFCAYASSFRGVRDSELAQSETKDFSVAITTAEYSAVNDISSEVLIKFQKDKKSIFIDGKKIDDRKELISIIPCIIFCHEDMDFVKGTPEQRRWFFDQVLSLYDSVYLEDLRCYRKAIKTRNNVLRDNLKQKSGDNPGPLLDALDYQCASYGTRLMEKRETAAKLFSEVFAPLYREVAGILDMTVNYTPSWKSSNEKESFNWLLKRRPIDMAAGTTLAGPHRDRYSFTVGGTNFVANASTGQRRLLALLLRVAQARRFSEMTGKRPVLLLDDVLLEMDGEKRRRFLSVLPGYDQAFFTFLPEEPFHQYGDGDTLVYYVKDGRVEAKDG